MPVLPRNMSDYMECPTPYLFGIGREWATPEELPKPAKDLILVDLDHNYLRGGCVAPELPEMELSALRERLRACNSDPLRCADDLSAFTSASPGASGATFAENDVRDAFRAAVMSLLSDVPTCSFRLSEPPGSSSAATDAVVFDEQCFIARHAARGRWAGKGGEPFMEQLVRAQAFSAHIAAFSGASDNPGAADEL